MFKVVKVLLMIFVLFSSLSCKNVSQDIISKEKEEIEKIFKYFNDKYKYIYEMSKLISLDKDVVNIYSELKRRVGNFSSEVNDESKTVFYRYGYDLKNIFDEKLRTYEKELIINVHFIIFPGRSWLKTNLPRGEDITLKDLLRERPVLQKVLANGEIYTGYEIIDGDLMYLSIIPVWGESGELLGCVEVSASLQAILANFLQVHSQKRVIVYVDPNFRGRLRGSDLLLLNNSIIYYKNIDLTNTEYENMFELVKKANFNKSIVSFKDVKYGIIHLNYIDRKTFGYILISLD